MRVRSVTVLGAGVAGLASALALARDGHEVTLLERDPVDVTTADDAFAWQRRGIPHFLQPHAFIPRGRAELRASFPDVYAALLAAGATEIDLRRKLTDDPRPGDEDLQYVAARRPVIEWALRRAVAAEPRIMVRSQVRPLGLDLDRGRVVGTRVDGSVVTADLVVDALGRRSPTARWLADLGRPVEPVETSDCGVVYYARYYRLRPGFEVCDGPWLLSPRGDLGYLAYASFPGDNRTLALLLAVPPGVPEWRALKDAAGFETAVATIPALRAWAEPGGLEPITDVMAMAGLRNSVRHFDGACPAGLFPVGDALCHLDPVLAHGLAFALVHAVELARALREHADVEDAGRTFADAVGPELRERFDFATALDEQRHRMWTGGSVDFAHADGDYALFSMAAAGAAAIADPIVLRVFARRTGLLDRTGVLDDDDEMQRRIEEVFARLSTVPRPSPGPVRDEMLALTASA